MYDAAFEASAPVTDMSATFDVLLAAASRFAPRCRSCLNAALSCDGPGRALRQLKAYRSRAVNDQRRDAPTHRTIGDQIRVSDPSDLASVAALT